jgi:hypothetical protein
LSKLPLAKYAALLLVLIIVTKSPYNVTAQPDLLLNIDPIQNTRLQTGQTFNITGKILHSNSAPLGYENSAIHFQENGYIDYERIMIDESFVCSILIRIDADNNNWNTLLDHRSFRVWTWPPENKTETQIAFTTWNTKNEETNSYGNIPTNKWIQLTLTRNSTTQTIYLSDYTLASTPVNGPLKTGEGKLRVGAGIDNSLFFKGSVDEVKLYTNKSDADIKSIIAKDYPQDGLALDFDLNGDKNPGTNSTSGSIRRVSGIINAEILITLGNSTTNNIHVNSSTGAFTTQLQSPTKAGEYSYIAQIVKPYTSYIIDFKVTCDNLELKEKGFENLKNRDIFWCKPTYAFDGAPLDNSTGRVMINDADASWSSTAKRWEYDYTGQTQLTITNITDIKYNLSLIEAIEINLPTTENLILWVPSLIFTGLIILLAILLVTGKMGFKIKSEPGRLRGREWMIAY